MSAKSAVPADDESRTVESRLRGSLEDAHSALEEARLLMYAQHTRDDPVVAEGMADIAEHLAAGAPFEDAIPIGDYVDGKKQGLTD